MGAEINFSEDLKAAIESATVKAADLHHPHVDGVHVLFGLASGSDDVALTLQRLGLRPDDVSKQIIDDLGLGHFTLPAPRNEDGSPIFSQSVIEAIELCAQHGNIKINGPLLFAKLTRDSESSASKLIFALGGVSAHYLGSAIGGPLEQADEDDASKTAPDQADSGGAVAVEPHIDPHAPVQQRRIVAEMVSDVLERDAAWDADGDGLFL